MRKIIHNNIKNRQDVIKNSYYCQQLQKHYKDADKISEVFASKYLNGVDNKMFTVNYNNHLTL